MVKKRSGGGREREEKKGEKRSKKLARSWDTSPQPTHELYAPMVVLDWDAEVTPAHPALQYEAAVHVRVCVRLPDPHVVLHVLHVPHEVQVPAMAIQWEEKEFCS